MAKISTWLKKTFDSLVDPEKESRVGNLKTLIAGGLQTQKKGFSLSKALQGIEYDNKDLQIVKEGIYRDALERGWGDGVLTETEIKVSQWIAQKVELSPSQKKLIDEEYAKEHFALAICQAMEDGVLDDAEEAHLKHIASAAGYTLPQFARMYFQHEGGSFLRVIFLAAISDGVICQKEWDRLLKTSAKLGISHAEMLSVIKTQARQFVEHVLVDAKSDGKLSEQEEATLNWLINNLELDHSYRNYIATEIKFLRTLTNIYEGKLPSIKPPPGMQTRAGEIIYFHIPAIWRHVRHLKSGPRVDDHQGTLTLTDNRVIFSAPTKSQTLNYRRIVSHQGGLNWIEIQVDGKPVSTFYLSGESQIPYAIFSSAVSMSNQTKVAKTKALPSRHVPRDVRQRVWQRFGGRCAECNADDYLEFDHIIPVAKGGSNSDANIQLLCRRCNLKKSDHI